MSTVEEERWGEEEGRWKKDEEGRRGGRRKMGEEGGR